MADCNPAIDGQMPKGPPNVPALASMPNRARPRCPSCESAMDPVFRKGPRGKAFVRVPDAFICGEHNVLARGRQKTQFLN